MTSWYNRLVIRGNKVVGMNWLPGGGDVEVKPISELIGWDLYVTLGHVDDDQKVVMRIQKAGKSKFMIPCIKGRSASITYGIAVYDGKRRVSEVVYFKSNVSVLRTVGVDELEMDGKGGYMNDGIFRQYLSV